jgi:uncharacterized membrane protein
MIKVLYTGDEVIFVTTYVKGMNSWTDGVVHGEAGHMLNALRSDPEIEVDYIPTSKVQNEFPSDFSKYDVVIYSDVGTDTVIMYEDRFYHCPMGKNRLGALKEFVKNGGGIAGIGGWMSFGGMYGQAKWHNTPIEEVLPVTCHPWDDRVELSEGMTPNIVKPDHPIMDGVAWNSAPVLFSGYNEVEKKPDGELLAEYNGDPILVVGNYGKGRTLAFATDIAPHWGRGFVDWEGSVKFSVNMVKWLAGKK